MIKFSAHLPWGTMVARVSDLVISIGRNRSNLIVLNEPSVSAAHARVSWTGSAYRIEDLGSVNGVWVNGVAISETSISRSLTFFLGSVRCVLEVCDPCFVCNDESRFLIAAPSITVGRAGDNNWVIAHPSVSSHHLCLILEGEQMFVRNLSSQGTRVGGLLINDASIASGEVIQIGDAYILYATPLLVDEGFSFEPSPREGSQSGERFRVLGSLGRDQAEEFSERLEAAFRDGGEFLDLDMSACSKLHPRCLDVLLEAAKYFSASSRRLRLVAPSPAVMRAVALANVSQRLILW